MKKRKTLLKSKIFKGIFFIPYGLWFFISLIVLIPDKNIENPVTWKDLLVVDIVFLLMWFTISIAIVYVLKLLKKIWLILSRNEIYVKGKDKTYASINDRSINWIKLRMRMLFILTILSLIGALATSTGVSFLLSPGIPDVFSYTWISWLWIPIPMLSIALGNKYTDEGYDCFNNVAVGYIIGGFLLIYGSISMLKSIIFVDGSYDLRAEIVNKWWFQMLCLVFILVVFYLLEIIMTYRYNSFVKIWNTLEIGEAQKKTKKYLNLYYFISIFPHSKNITYMRNNFWCMLATLEYEENNIDKFLYYLNCIRSGEKNFDMKFFILALYYRSRNDEKMARYYYDRLFNCEKIDENIEVILQVLFDDREQDKVFETSISAFQNRAIKKLLKENGIEW